MERNHHSSDSGSPEEEQAQGALTAAQQEQERRNTIAALLGNGRNAPLIRERALLPRMLGEGDVAYFDRIR